MDDLQKRLCARLSARAAVPQASAPPVDRALTLNLGGGPLAASVATKSAGGATLRATLGRTRSAAAAAPAAKTAPRGGAGSSRATSPLKSLVDRGRVSKKRADIARARAPAAAASKMMPPQPPSAGTKRAGSPTIEEESDALTFLESIGMTPSQLSAMTSGDFKYLRRIPGRQLYNLELVAQHEIDRTNYLTLSKAGVTHFQMSDSTFTPFSVWQHEYVVFHQIRLIRFFRIYRQWKSFFEWKRNVRSFRFNTAKRKLVTTLFSMNPDLRSSMAELFAMCCDATDRGLFDIKDGTISTMKEFTDAQRAKRTEETEWLEEFNNNIRSCVRKACDNVLDVFLRENNMSADNKMSFMERAALRNFCRWLTKFIRLADLLVSDTLLSMAQTSLDGLLLKVKTKMLCATKTLATNDDIALDRDTADPASRPLFSFSVSFKDGEPELIMSPSSDDFLSRMLSVMRKGCEVVVSSERIIAHESLLPYTQTALAEQEVEEQYTMMHGDSMGKESFGDDDGASGGGQGAAILSRAVLGLSIGPVLEKTAVEIREAMKDAFGKVDDYNHHFDEYRDIFLTNLKAQKETMATYCDANISVFNAAIVELREQSKYLSNIPLAANVGIVYIDSLVLRDVMLPSPGHSLEAICRLIPKLIEGTGEELNEAARMFVQRIEATVHDVPAFIAKVKAVEEGKAATPTMTDQLNRIMLLKKLMEEQDWSVPGSAKSVVRDADQLLMSLEANIRAAEASAEDDSAHFKEKIDKHIPKLRGKLQSVQQKAEDGRIAAVDTPLDTALDILHDLKESLDGLTEEIKNYQSYQELLGENPAEFETLDEIIADVGLKDRIWNGRRNWELKTNNWKATAFKDLDGGDITKEVMQFAGLVAKAKRALPNNKVVPLLDGLVQDFRAVEPIINALRSPSLKPRHWAKIETIIEHEFDPDKEYTLGEYLELGVTHFSEEIEAIQVEATQEAVLEEIFMTKVSQIWRDLSFEVLPYKDSKDIFILGSVEEIQVQLDDSLVAISTIMASRFGGEIRKKVTQWQQNLILLGETLEEWLTTQRNWMYLETIFSAKDIQKQLPGEYAAFQKVDLGFKDIMRATNNIPNAVEAGTSNGKKLREQFKHYNKDLDKIQKQLEAYLETKRMAFARFYFLSDEELLMILAQTRDPTAVQPHLRKCFEALNTLVFKQKGTAYEIHAMVSSKGEEIPLGVLKVRGKIEQWLKQVEDRMKSVLTRLMKQGVKDYEVEPRSDWLLSHKGQISATVAYIAWTMETEAACNADDPIKAMKAHYELQVGHLAEMTRLVRSKLSKLERKVVICVSTTDVHGREIVGRLVDKGITDVGNFDWQMQLRFYWDLSVDNCIVRQSTCEIPFGYEYEGIFSRLVITPLTDRCWLTITGAIHLRLGAAPAGPAGTGKTESSKDLAKGVGILCIVFNCSDQISYKMLGTLFCGLAQVGCWTCLDEFNRINIEVLSVVAQQLLTLSNGRRQAEGEPVEFEGRTLPVVLDHIVIITMNPGYAGRTALPDNLKIFFRPVAMMVPDYALIAEIMLFAEGFDDSMVLARKMVRSYHLSSEQLSQQPHYDYGLRAVRSVLVMAGTLKRSNPTVTEDIVLIRAMRDSNLPKFLQEDLPLYFAILGDLFPGVVVPFNDNGDFEIEVRHQIQRAGLQPNPKFITKVVELFEIFKVRFGVVITGPTCGAKTTCYEILKEAMCQLRTDGHPNEDFQKVSTYILNPKCVTMGELYGEMNEVTQEWVDGLAASIMRSHTLLFGEDQHWTVFDGPIDAIWIENMNTVLDDNQTLCLANGERIKLRSQMRMLFEVNDLEVASPATVSRLGVVYYTPSNIGWQTYVESWLIRQQPEVQAPLMALFERTMQHALDFYDKFCDEPVETYEIQRATAVTRLLDHLLEDRGFKKIDATLFTEQCEARAEEYITAVAAGTGAGVDDLHLSEAAGVPDIGLADKDDVMAALEPLFAFAMVWGIGGAMAGGRDQWDNEMRDLFELNWGPANTVFDAYYDVSEKKFKKWEDMTHHFDYDPAAPYFELVVPTPTTTCFETLMTWHLLQDNGTFLTGVTGTGKTVIIESMIKNLKAKDSHLNITINYSAQTNAKQVQLTVESKLEKKRKGLLGGPGGKKVIIFVDDVNMPEVEEYGAQPPVELMRQFACFLGFWDREKMGEWKNIIDSTLVICAAPPEGGRSPLTPRFQRHFHVLCVPPASKQVLTRIFTSILTEFLTVGKFDDSVKALTAGIVKSSIDVYNSIREELRPTPTKFHYTFNLRDVSKVFQGLLMVTSRTIKTAKGFSKLWVHETMRVFHDRLNTEEDKTWFTALLQRLAESRFSISDDMFSEESWPVLFGDFLRGHPEPGEPTVYEIVKDRKTMTKVLNEQLEDYNISNPTTMELVFFLDAMKHVVRISRILRQPRGNAMLIGVGGSGKQSLTRIASFMANVACRSIGISRGYGIEMFREDIKNFFLEAGVEAKPVAWLFTDSQIVEEGFLEDINNILNTGDIPNLWENDEINRISNDMLPHCKKKNIPGTRDNCIQLFISNIRDNLHIVLGMSPVGDMLRIRCRQFPALINCCTIDYYSAWPRDALLEVAHHKIGNSKASESDAVKNALSEMCANIHMSIGSAAEEMFATLLRQTYTTPKSFLDLISVYLKMLGEKRTEISLQIERMQTGVDKLNESNEKVEILNVELTALAPILKVKGAEAAVMLEDVSKRKAAADIVQVKVESEAAVVGKQAAAVKVKADEAQALLDEALPAVEKANAALASLSKDKVTELKSFATPPPAVEVTMECVSILLGAKKKELSWKTSKKFLGDMKFREHLMTYDKDNIPESILKVVRKYCARDDFQVESVMKVSSAAGAIAAFCHAMKIYADISKEVEPKRILVAQLNSELATANAALKIKVDALNEVLAEVQGLQDVLAATIAEKKELEDKSALTEGRLVRAEKLTVGLADEGVRWRESVTRLTANRELLVGDVFISAAMISYIGPFTGSFRDTIIKEWVEGSKALSIPMSEQYSLFDTMGNPNQVRNWQIDGLPTDSVSTDNAIICSRCERWPLMIDPQEQAKGWIKKFEGRHGLACTRMDDINLLRTLESSIRVGKPMLVEDISEFLDPSLEPILQRAVFNQGGRRLITLGDSDVDYDDNFRMYITTKMPNPHYLPEVCIKVTIINFLITFEGLQDQLLGQIVRCERPDVEERNGALVVSMANDNAALSDLESKILKLLSEAEGATLLDNVVLIDALEESKKLSNTINKRLEQSKIVAKEIAATRAGYVPVATRGSTVYFVIADLAKIDPMYEYSLQFYIRLFNHCMRAAEKNDDLETRLATLLVYCTETIYSNICRGLFEKHKLLFSVLLCVQILVQRDDVGMDEYGLLLRGAGSAVCEETSPDDIILPAGGWNFLFASETAVHGVPSQSPPVEAEIDPDTGEEFMPHFTPSFPMKGIIDHVLMEWPAWKAFAEKTYLAESTGDTSLSGGIGNIPAPYNTKLSPFQQLLLVKAMAPDRINFALQDFVASQMGSQKFVETSAAKMDEVYADTNSATPTVFILSTGADPTGVLQAFAKKVGFFKKLDTVALGQGQGPVAERLIKRAVAKGRWVCLQNCHLAQSWLPDLEQIVMHLADEDGDENLVHEDFRLFLTSMPARCVFGGKRV